MTTAFDVGGASDQVYLELFGSGIRGGKTVTATLGGGTPLSATSAAQPQYPGMDQVNVLVPKNMAGRGEVDVVVTVDGAASNTVKVRIQ